MKRPKDAYDFIDDEPAPPEPKKDSGSPLLRLGTIYFLVAALALIGYFIFIYFNPHHALNPFPPPTQAGEAEAALALPTDTPKLLPSLTPTVGEAVSAGEASATPTAKIRPTLPPPVYPTPTDVILMTATASGTQEARRFYIAREESPSYLAHGSGCTGLYVAGNVVDIESDPVMLLTVRVTGTLGDQPVNLEALSGSNAIYTESGWEIKLSDQLMNTFSTRLPTAPKIWWWSILSSSEMTVPGPLIRKALPSDAEAISYVHIRTWQNAYASIFPKKHLDELTDTFDARADHWRENIAAPEAIPVLVVAETPDGQVIGFAGAGKQTDPEHIFESELFVLYVLPEFQHRGVGRALFHAVVKELRHLGFSSMLLWTLVNNQSARRFYEKLGGILIGEKEFVRWEAQYPLVGYGWPDIAHLET
ncbi:MAG: GNAT family N-acetyltransferase [Anaerolineales bacterium]